MSLIWERRTNTFGPSIQGSGLSASVPTGTQYWDAGESTPIDSLARLSCGITGNGGLRLQGRPEAEPASMGGAAGIQEHPKEAGILGRFVPTAATKLQEGTANTFLALEGASSGCVISYGVALFS